MKSTTRTIILFALTLILCTAVHAQTYKATYEYDANGNRTKATVIYLTQLVTPTTPEEIKFDQETEKTLTIKVYPNPTQGNLRVEIIGASTEEITNSNNAIMVWDLQGRAIQTIKPIDFSNTVDLSNQKDGVYLMKLMLNGKEKQFKIVKN